MIRSSPFRQCRALPLQLVDVDPDATEFHLRQHRDERSFEIPVQIPELLLLKLVADDLRQLPGDVGIFRGVLGGLVDLHFKHLQLLLSLPDQIRDGNHLPLQVAFGEFVEAVAAGTRIQQVVAHHRIDADVPDRHPGPLEHEHVVLDVLVRDDAGVPLENRLERLEHHLAVQHRLARRAVDRNVVPRSRLPAERPADNIRRQRVDARRLQVQTDLLLVLHFAQEPVECFLRPDDVPVALFVAGLLDLRAGDQRPHLLGVPAEAEVGVQLQQSLGIRLLDAGLFEIKFDRQVGLQRDQVATQQRLVRHTS